MGSLVGSYGVSHTAMMIRKYVPGNPVHEAVYRGFREIRDDIARLSPDLIVIISSEHLNTFQHDCFPQLCVGIGDSATGWGDGGVASAVLSLAGDFALDLLESAVQSGFDLAFAANPRIDHAFMAPLTLVRPEMDIPIVPIFQNANTEPLPPMWRCAQFGETLAAVIAARPCAERVVVLGAGGLSHWVGTPQMGEINTGFDERFLDYVRDGDLDAIVALKNDDIVDQAGNGAPEIRNWVMAMKASPPGPASVIAYRSVPEWATGIALARFYPHDRP